MIPRLKDEYEKKIIEDLQKKFSMKSKYMVPKFVKVVLNMGLGLDANDKKKLQNCVVDMSLISGQKPVVTKFKKSISNFKSRKGTVGGLNINQSSGGSLEDRPSINIRGTTTIGNGSTGSPLVLIDGMQGDINAINPQDIESVSVLKDAAAASIYGSRAAFGVILVTTKDGKKGAPSVQYSTNIRLSSPINTPEMMDSYTFALFFNDANMNGGNGPIFSQERLQRIQDYQNGTFPDPIIPNPNNPSRWADGYAEGNANTDWYDAIYRDQSFSQEHNFSLRGGGDNINYYVLRFITKYLATVMV